ncbi:DUF4381 domain-containing protein [Ferrimonas balearica]|uniref:DUF4381 domain-containing protein n=1 Tax=Ferrimonas balearica TaxID=44012 RepID=UPI001C99AA5F|nr:DUF4381 domain-containing protein [Ferrimonas balearica]MBY5992961.1 DUF4381 domain-containing protein [Ferrimonas balearica]
MNPGAALHDITLPGPLSPWPALWVWLIPLALLALLALALWLYRRRRHRLAPLRAAQQELAQLKASEPTLPAQVQALLKRCCLAYYPREGVAKLSGDPWYAFLDRALAPTERGQWPKLMGNPYAAEPGHGGEALLRHCARVLPKLGDRRPRQEGPC